MYIIWFIPRTLPHNILDKNLAQISPPVPHSVCSEINESRKHPQRGSVPTGTLFSESSTQTSGSLKSSQSPEVKNRVQTNCQLKLKVFQKDSSIEQSISLPQHPGSLTDKLLKRQYYKVNLMCSYVLFTSIPRSPLLVQ